MPQGSLRVSVPLTNLSVLYKNEEYIAGKVLKDIPVKKDSDLYWVYNNDFRVSDSERMNGSLANMVTWEASTNSYYCKEHALKDVITDTDRANTDAPLNLDKDTMEYLIDKIMLRYEYEAQKVLFTTTTWGNNTTLTTATSWNYNTTTAQTPTSNVLSGCAAILGNAGVRPNAGITNFSVMASLKENKLVYERIMYAEKAIITEDIVAAMFDIQNLYVGTANYAQGKEGATASMTSIWGRDFLLAYINPNPGLKSKTAAATLRVTEKGNPYRVKKWRSEDVEGDYIEVQTKFVVKAIATNCGFFIKSANLI